MGLGKQRSGEADGKQYEFRVYKIAGYVLASEQEFLHRHSAENHREVLGIIYEELFLLSQLMTNIDPDFECDSHLFRMIGEKMDENMKLLDSVCSLLSDWELVKGEVEI